MIQLRSVRSLQALAAVAVAALAMSSLPALQAVTAVVLIAPAAVAGVGRLAARSGKARVGVARQTPFALTLIATALRSGQSVTAAVALAAPAADPQTTQRLDTVVGLLRLGAAPEQAWQDDDADEVWNTIARVARQSSYSGVRAASALEQLATDLRERRQAEAESRAERAAVYAVAPLGLCFLPAFVCVGIVPVVVGIVSGLGLRLH